MQDLPALNSDGQTFLGNGGGAVAPSGPTGATTGMPDMTGALGFGANMALGMTGIGRVPGVGALTSGVVQGKSFDDIQDAVLGSLAGWGVTEALQSTGLGYGLPGIAGGIAAEAVKDNPQYGAAAVTGTARATGALLGGSVLGLPGAMIGSEVAGRMVGPSLQDGYLGDAVGSRSYEKKRDVVEDTFGVDVDVTKGMAQIKSLEDMLDRIENMTEEMGGVKTASMKDDMGTLGQDAFGTRAPGFDFGLDSAFDSTSAGKMQGAVDDNAFGLEDFGREADAVGARATSAGSLEGFYDARDRDSDSANDSSSSGSGIGGQSGADLGKGGESW